MAASAPDGRREDEHALAVAGVVHDVNQMLTVITGRAELLRLRGEWHPGDLDVITLAARDAAAMLRRLTAGADAVAAASACLATCLEAVVLVHQPPQGAWARGSGPTSAAPWRLRMDVPADLTVAAPAQVVREVVGNLVANAVEAMGAGGELGLEATAAGPRVRLTVRDTGPGLAPGDRERIFAAGWSTRRGDGRGVGLAASRQLLAAWDGTLIAAEPEGRGAVFVLELPAASEDAPARQAGEPLALAGPVLVVDDEPAVREVLAEVLGAWGLQVATAADAGQARGAWLLDRQPLVMVDMTLPGASGLELADWLRQQDRRPAVVLMTGVDRARELPSDVDSRCDAVATKPLDFGGLRPLLAGAITAARAGAPKEGPCSP